MKETVNPFTTPRELELLNGMCNCYSVCGADFEDTIRMVGRSRGLEPKQVREILDRIKETHSDEREYLDLRKRLPADFPL